MMMAILLLGCLLQIARLLRKAVQSRVGRTLQPKQKTA